MFGRQLLGFFVILLYFFGFWAKYFTSVHIVVPIIFFFLSAGTSLLYLFTDKMSLGKVPLSMLFIVLVSIIAIIVNKNHTIADGILLLSWICIGCFLWVAKSNWKFFYQLSLLSFIYLALVIIIKFMLKTPDITLTERSGSNTISILVLQFFAIDFIYNHIFDKSPNKFLYVIGIAISWMAGGIAGIIVVFLCVFGLCVSNIINSKKGKRNLIFIIMIGAILSYNYRNTFLSFLETGDINSRFLLWNAYFDMAKNDISSFLFGANIHNNYLLEHYKNMHNTYINWHYYFGLIPMIIFLYIVIKSIANSLKKHKLSLLVICLSLFIRGLSDEATYAFMIIWMYLYCSFVYSSKTIRIYGNYNRFAIV